MNSTFLTAREIAEILRVSKPWVYRLIANGAIPSIRFGRVTRVRREDLDAFIQNSALKFEPSGIASHQIDVSSQENGGDRQDI